MALILQQNIELIAKWQVFSIFSTSIKCKMERIGLPVICDAKVVFDKPVASFLLDNISSYRLNINVYPIIVLSPTKTFNEFTPIYHFGLAGIILELLSRNFVIFFFFEFITLAN